MKEKKIVHYWHHLITALTELERGKGRGDEGKRIGGKEKGVTIH